MPAARNDARLNVRLPAELKRTIEEAALQLGQTVSEFAVSTLTRSARQVIQEEYVTTLTQRDWERFTALIDDESAAPNAALKAAANRYKKRARR